MPEDRRVVSYIELFSKFEAIAIGNGLTLNARRIDSEHEFDFYFTRSPYDIHTSKAIRWNYEKESVNDFLYNLNELARNFKKGLKYEH